MAGITITKGALAKYAQQLSLSGIPEGKTLIDISSLDGLKADSKRIKVIDGDTFFDVCFKGLLILNFSQRGKEVRKLFDPSIGGPLVSLTHKARLAYALGLIDKTVMNDVVNIHKIRNEFAHSADASFTKTEVIKLVEKLSTADNHKVTARNSYKLYDSASVNCWTSFTEIIKQEVYRQAMLANAKKEANSRTKKSKNNK